MSKNYILIDYENVKAGNLGLLAGHPLHVMIFIGARQPKIPVELAMQVQSLEAAEYIRISGNGPNALDFHIAFYIGSLTERDPGAGFYIVSKDKGFGPLIDHLKARKVNANRVDDISGIPRIRKASPVGGKKKPSTGDKKKIDTILKNLSNRGSSRPRKMKTLSSTIAALFKGELDEKKIGSLIEKLRTAGHIVVNGENVSYNLPGRTDDAVS